MSTAMLDQTAVLDSDAFDIDAEFTVETEMASPAITSVVVCTPGCGPSVGTFCTACCC
ncbi:gallidermin/nisin family lantibiotic [Crossiella equi]|uniref:Gallidermin/nisin family lantibiotic n=1 Tax=Crossiella equi TaxID=130796 RepID=A0ABS5ACR0_9PSEU|nr:FDLD family class I lanthipeptide [Crossiella equi]MBP2473994.1 gallidermin/nisin family lantibiotic [Crossiella equi]